MWPENKRQIQGKILLCSRQNRRRQWHPTPVLLPGKSHGRRRLVGCSPWVVKSRTRLSDFTFTFHFYPLEKEMATHSSVLAWRILGMGEPGGLPFMGSHRVGHDWSDLAAAAAAAAMVRKITESVFESFMHWKPNTTFLFVLNSRERTTGCGFKGA